MLVVGLGLAILVSADTAAKVGLFGALMLTILCRRLEPKRDKETVFEMGVRALDALVVVTMYAALTALIVFVSAMVLACFLL
jgi:hypothetical protein